MLASYMQGEGNGGVFAPQNLGLYSYRWNNPVRMRDPDGRQALDVVAPVAPFVPTAGPPVGPPVGPGSAPSMGPGALLMLFYQGYRLGEYDGVHGTILGFGTRQSTRLGFWRRESTAGGAHEPDASPVAGSLGDVSAVRRRSELLCLCAWGSVGTAITFPLHPAA